MRKFNYAKFFRVSARNWVLFIAFFGVSVAQAGTIQVGQKLSGVTDLGLFWHIPDGGTAKVYSAYASAPTFTAAADGALMRGSGSLALGAGKSAAINVATGITGAEIAAGALKFMRGPGGLLLTVGMPILMDYLRDNNLRVNDARDGLEEKRNDINSEYLYGCGITPTIYSSAIAACQAEVVRSNAEWCSQYACSSQFKITGCGATSCTKIAFYWSVEGVRNPGGDGEVNFSKVKNDSYIEKWVPISFDGAGSRFVNPAGPNIIPEVINKGGDFDAMSPSLITGPSSIPGPVTTTTGSDGKTTSSREDTKLSYDKDKVTTSIVNVTNNTVTNSDNSTTTTTTTTTVENPNEPTDLCKEHPDILACSKPEFDVPDDDIPKANKNITYTDESPFGGGSCPANLVTNLGTLHQTVTVWDWQKTCEYALPLRALIISLASFAAFLIVMPGETRV